MVNSLVLFVIVTILIIGINSKYIKTKTYKKEIKRVGLWYDESNLHVRQLRYRSSDVIPEILNLSPSELTNADEIKLELTPHGEKMIFSAVKEVPRQIGFFYGEIDGGKKVINLLSTEKNGVFGSMIDTSKKEIYQFQPKFDGKMHTIQKNVDEFLDYEDIIKMQENWSGFYPQEGTHNDNGNTIDIMVVWTRSAECHNSALPDDCIVTHVTRNNMIGKINLAVAETNVAFALSGVNSKLRLVHCYLHPTYVESDLLAALNEITKNSRRKLDDDHKKRRKRQPIRSRGNLDDVHEKRAKYGADIVSLWINHHICGLGWMGPVKEYMFSVVSHLCATGYFSFGHEIAHNLGCKHDRGTQNECNNTALPSYGYRDNKSIFRDIMAYNCVSGQCDSNDGISCARVQRFSNNYLEYEGLPIGDERNNCAHHINTMSSIVASYFAAKTEEELAALNASELERSRTTFSPTSPNCKESRSSCNLNSLCCSGDCRWRRCL